MRGQPHVPSLPTCAITLSRFAGGGTPYPLPRSAPRKDGPFVKVNCGAIPVTAVDPTPARVREAALLKSQYPLPYADAFAIQLAVEKNLPLVTGDPEIRPLHDAGVVSVKWIGRSKRPRRRTPS